jgi:competence protein ComEC
LHLLLLVATALLVYNPTWIGNLGFQFSFLATLGLMLLATPIAQSLTLLPPALAELIAVPTAAYLWTLPLQLYQFGLINTYSILLNAVAAPLIMVLTLGGMVTAVVGLVLFPVGVWAAQWLSYPMDVLLAVVQWTNQLPYNSLAVGKITAGQMVILYVLLGLVCSGWSLVAAAMGRGGAVCGGAGFGAPAVQPLDAVTVYSFGYRAHSGNGHRESG